MRSESPDEFGVRAAGLLVGGALLLLGLPGLLGATLDLPAAPALLAIRESRPVAAEDLARAVASAERSQRWGGNAVSLSDLSLLKLMQAESSDTLEPERLRLLQESRTIQEASLARAPASTDGWARLTFARYSLSVLEKERVLQEELGEGLDPASRAALEMSFRTGRLERAPMLFRIQILLREWETLDPELRALGNAQIRQLSRYNQRDLDALIDVYQASDRAGREIIWAALSDLSERGSPGEEDRARFERRLRQKIPSVR